MKFIAYLMIFIAKKQNQVTLKMRSQEDEKQNFLYVA